MGPNLLFKTPVAVMAEQFAVERVAGREENNLGLRLALPNGVRYGQTRDEMSPATATGKNENSCSHDVANRKRGSKKLHEALLNSSFALRSRDCDMLLV